MAFTGPTIEGLSHIITRPKLTEKLLSRPPFRFLHDIVHEVMKATKFADGLYTESELDSKTMTDRDSKVGFLQKIIYCVNFALDISLSVKPIKVVAGMEPKDTNEFLQRLAEAASKVATQEVDSERAVERVLAGEVPGGASAAAPPPRTAPVVKPPPAQQAPPISAPAPKKDEPKPPQVTKPAVVPALPAAAPAPQLPKAVPVPTSHKKPAPVTASIPMPQPPSVAPAVDAAAEPTDSSSGQPSDSTADDIAARVHLERPMTARRAPPKVESGVRVVKTTKPKSEYDKSPGGGGGPADTSAPETAGPVVFTDEKDNDDSDDDLIEEAGSDAGGIDDSLALLDDPGIKLGQVGTDTGPAEHGQLVADIMATQQKLADAAKADVAEEEAIAKEPGKTTDDDLFNAVDFGRTGKDREAKRKEVEALKTSLQSLSKSANPLGRYMDYMHEDLDAMSREFENWQRDAKQYKNELVDIHQKTQDALEPLEAQLKQLNASILEQAGKLSVTKANILRGEVKLQKMLRMRTQG